MTTPSSTTSTANSSASESFATSMSRAGCLTCRGRKKKCDMTYPICGACSRLNYICERENPRLAPPRPKRQRKERAQSIKNESLVRRDSIFIHDGSAPTPEKLPPSLVWNDTEHEYPNATKTTNRRLILRYYTQYFTTLLTTTRENNSFLGVFLPMAMDSPLLMDAILAWSSAHLALRNDRYGTLALEHRSTSLQNFSKALAADSHDLEIKLACSLIHCAMESITGSTMDWYRHHIGAYHLIRSLCNAEEGTTLDPSLFARSYEAKWLLSSFAYHDIMMAVAEDTRPLITAGRYWENQRSEAATPNTYFGLASEVMYLLSEACVLNADIPNLDKESRFTVGSDRAKALEAQLIACTCASARDSGLSQLAQMYKSAALLYLYRVMLRHFPELFTFLSFRVGFYLSDIIRRLHQVPQGSLVESSLLFPLFIAGGEAESTEDIGVIRSRMRQIVEDRHFHNMRVCAEVLEELWQQRSAHSKTRDARRPDWRDVLDRRNWKISIT